jgi:murein DD-endopeptidase MepM/ murein hydrolase activator NlpD
MIRYHAHRRPWLSTVLLLVTLSACDRQSIQDFFTSYTPRERYERRLQETGLDQTALGRDWMEAASEVLERPIPINAPYLEESYFDSREAAASGYRISLRRGQRLDVMFESAPDSGYRVFLDLFRMRRDSLPRLLTSADSLERTLEYLVRRDDDYLVRIQPELLRGGQYAITIVVRPSLEFPVSGHDTTAIRSWYGDPRDGGRRQHEGLDIFAPRGTPVLAAASGVIRSTRPNNLGGNVIWLRDDRNRTHYYAHLDSQAVRRGDRVQAGDTIGFVGNSGNARTTPPHLHFGVYARGSFDPYPALYQPPTTPTAFTGEQSLIGEFVRVNREQTRIRTLPAFESAALAELSLHTPLFVEAGSGVWYRVRLPDGGIGFVATRLTEPVNGPLEHQVVAGGGTLLADPDSSAAVVERLDVGAEVDVLGAFGEFLFVQGPSGRPGWLASN